MCCWDAVEDFGDGETVLFVRGDFLVWFYGLEFMIYLPLPDDTSAHDQGAVVLDTTALVDLSSH